MGTTQEFHHLHSTYLFQSHVNWNNIVKNVMYVPVVTLQEVKPISHDFC